MLKTVKTVIATGIIVAAPAVFAATQNDNAASSESMGQMGQMDNGMGNMHDGNMMPMMARMNDMMETCNKMMQGMMKNSGSQDSGPNNSPNDG